MCALKTVVIDDDPLVLTFLKHVLQNRRYSVQTFAHPADSPLYQYKSCPCSFEGDCPDLIISDINMPLINGVDLLDFAMTKGCRCRHLALISGQELTEPDANRMAKYGTQFFAKPLDLGDFYFWLDRVEQDVAMLRSN